MVGNDSEVHTDSMGGDGDFGEGTSMSEMGFSDIPLLGDAELSTCESMNALKRSFSLSFALV